MTTRRHQGYPYNMYCPMGVGGQTIVGCVATATARMLKYHDWPPFGIDSARHYWRGNESYGDDTPGVWLIEYFDDPYDWDNMFDHVGSSAPHTEQMSEGQAS